jgi:RNA polymerase sigma-70 factor (ECF subfamily)
MEVDGTSWDETLRRIRPLLRLLAGRTVNPRHWKRADPSDMVQKTLLEAHEKKSSFRGSTEMELVAWLKIMLGHRVVDELRKLKCQKNDADLDVSLERAITQLQKWTSPLSALVRHEEALRLAEALEKIPEDQRTAVEFIYFHRLPPTEAAALMDRSPGAVAGLLRRAQDKLRELLKETR